jgi:hypothetical protein
MTDPNAGASPQSVADSLSGSDGNGNALSYALVAMLYDANLFGLSKDYAYSEGSNTSASRLDQITTLAKLLTRTHTHADGNTYDLFDGIQTIVKWVLTQDPTINNGEVNSVNPAKPAS